MAGTNGFPWFLKVASPCPRNATDKRSQQAGKAKRPNPEGLERRGSPPDPSPPVAGAVTLPRCQLVPRLGFCGDRLGVMVLPLRGAVGFDLEPIGCGAHGWSVRAL